MGGKVVNFGNNKNQNKPLDTYEFFNDFISYTGYIYSMVYPLAISKANNINPYGFWNMPGWLRLYVNTNYDEYTSDCVVTDRFSYYKNKNKFNLAFKIYDGRGSFLLGWRNSKNHMHDFDGTENDDFLLIVKSEERKFYVRHKDKIIAEAPFEAITSVYYELETEITTRGRLYLKLTNTKTGEELKVDITTDSSMYYANPCVGAWNNVKQDGGENVSALIVDWWYIKYTDLNSTRV